MARTDTLTNFLTDVANAIRNKKGTTNQISASDFDTEIASITTSGSSNYNLQSKVVNPSTVTRTYTPDTGYYGLSSVQVNKVTASIDSNIIAGNIKKGVSILGVAGSYEASGSSGGLPTGFTAISTGTFTVASDVTANAYYKVAHDLGVAPSFVVVYIEGVDDIKNIPDGIVYFTSNKQNINVNGSNFGGVYNTARAYVYSTTVTVMGQTSTINASAVNTFFSANEFGILTNATNILKAGYTYRWIAGTIA